MKCLHPLCNNDLRRDQKKYCSRSCANSCTNRENPKRKVEGKCRTCDKPVHTTERWCSTECKPLPKGRNRQLVSKGVVSWRQRTKLKLVEYFDNKCHDCELSFPPFMYDFDHKEPSEKSFGISAKSVKWETILEEAKKCDMVCANCHRLRTHKQRCSGCEHCLIPA